MSKMVVIHSLTLKPETDIEAFETFVAEELSQYVWNEGSSHRIVTYDEGVKSTEYLLIFEHNEAFYNATKDERREIVHGERDILDPQNPKLVDKLRSYTIDLFREGTFTQYHTLS